LLDPSGGAPRLGRSYSDQSAHDVEAAIKAILERAFQTASAILARNQPLLEKAAAQLLACETLTEQQLVQLFAAASVPDDISDKAGPRSHTQCN
jgi:cell division protease FtsH